MLFRMPVVSTWLVSAVGLAFRASLHHDGRHAATAVGVVVVGLVPRDDDLAARLVPRCGLDLGMNELKKASPCCTVPSCSSLMRFGVYHTKSGGELS